ncbi:TAXI family TRAP transporter solute-binding subunit [Streptomyces sp. NPDC001549]|uniref:TAXI family TRAP transporter solute-binding subunit n=1 Tax=Streptomyces sp. NPDC001549 TaxID=3364586 RepID=UPI0036CD3874
MSAPNLEYGGIYQRGSIPAAVYRQPGRIPTIVVANVLLVKKGFDAGLAAKIVDLVHNEKNALVTVNQAAAEINATHAGQTAPVPLNPGAEKALEARTAP